MSFLDIALPYLRAFAVGGAICVAAQVVINFTKLTAGKILPDLLSERLPARRFPFFCLDLLFLFLHPMPPVMS